jgi:hypothetical protein
MGDKGASERVKGILRISRREGLTERFVGRKSFRRRIHQQVLAGGVKGKTKSLEGIKSGTLCSVVGQKRQ